MPLYKNKHIDWYRHLAFACVGGFFAAYAILCRSGVMGNAQTVNLLEMVIDALYGQGFKALEHFGALVIYVAGTMMTVLLPYKWNVNMRRLSPVVTAAMAVVLSLLPAEMDLTLSLYPIFFAMSVQWSSFRGAQNFYSSTIFSTNNTKQTSLALAEYLCTRDRGQLKRAAFFGTTLLCFHIGAAMGVGAVHLLAIRGILLVLPLLVWAFFVVTQEEKAELLAAGEENREVAG